MHRLAGTLTRSPVVRPEFYRYCRVALLLLLEQASPADYERVTTEPFPSSDFAGLKDVDRFGQLSGAPGATAELAQDTPGLELGLTRSLGPCSRA